MFKPHIVSFVEKPFDFKSGRPVPSLPDGLFSILLEIVLKKQDA